MSHTAGFLKLAAALVLAIATIPEAQAQSSTETAPAAVSPFKQCASELKITLPARGSGQRLTDQQREAIFSCVKTAKKAAFKQCASENGFTPGEGQKPTDVQKKAIHQCLRNLGFRHHRHHKGENGQPQAPSDESTAAPST